MRSFCCRGRTSARPVCGRSINSQFTTAAAAGNGGPSGPGADEIGGAIIVPPGFLLALMAGTGAGTTWIVNAGWLWAELDWPLP